MIVIDGRIDNRDELGAATGEDDPALVARLALAHGMANVVRKLAGDYAIAWYDGEEDTLWLVRDRLGVKPLYYTPRADGLAFASQPSMLLALEGIDPTPDRGFVARYAGSHYRTFDNDRHGSPYAVLQQIPAGHLLRVCRGSSTLEQYWDVTPTDVTGSERELAGEYRERFLDAVRRKMPGEAAAAFTLSGGLDSSSVLASAACVCGEPQIAYSAIYVDPTYDESFEIQPMLRALVREWRPLTIEPRDIPAIVTEMVRAHDEPVATATWLSHFMLCRSASADGIQVLFGGLGGDELNAGEYEYFVCHFADLRGDGDETALSHEIACWARHHDHPVYRKNAQIAQEWMTRAIDPREPGRCLPDRGRLMRYAHALSPEYRDALTRFEPVMDRPSTSYLKNRTCQDLFRETTPCCLRAQDRHGTAFGIEHRIPFLDHHLVEWMFRVPGRMKIRDGVTKQVLREAMVGILPDETRKRVKKVGWNAPAHQWFAGAGRDVLLDLIRSQRFRERDIYDLDETERLVIEHDRIVRSGEPVENHMMFLWQLVNLDVWLSGLGH